MQGSFKIDPAMLDAAERCEGALLFEGRTPGGLPLLIITAVGANVGLLKRAAVDVLPGLKQLQQTDGPPPA